MVFETIEPGMEVHPSKNYIPVTRHCDRLPIEEDFVAFTLLQVTDPYLLDHLALIMRFITGDPKPRPKSPTRDN